MKTSRLDKKTGFTLIELLTVIAIIGVLAAIIIPVTGKVRSSARMAQCKSTIRQVGLALLLFTEDHQGRFPARNTGGGWAKKLVDGGYVDKAGKALTCPVDKNAEQAERPRSYVYITPAMIPGNPFETGKSVVLQKFENPSRTMMLSEWHFSSQDYNKMDGGGIDQKAMDSPGQVFHPDGQRNFAFLDGHVSSFRKEDFEANDRRWGRKGEQSGAPAP